MKKGKYLIAVLMAACILLQVCGCSSEPERQLLPTMAPTAEPDTDTVHRLTCRIEPEEGGTARLSGDSARYGDTVELTVESNPGYKISSVKVDNKDVFFYDGVGKISGLTEDAEVRVTFTEKRENSPEKLTPGSITATFYNSEATEIGISWHTAQEGMPIIRYRKAEGADRGNPDFSEAVTVMGYVYFTAANYANYGVLRDLEPDTEYLYIVGDAEQNVFSEVCSFRTKAEQTDKMTFLHFSDSQDADNLGTVWGCGLQDALPRYENPAFILNTGDMVQEGGREELWRSMIGLNGTYLHKNILVYAAGNHDYWDSYLYGATKCAYSHFCVDVPNGQNVAYGMYYSFDYGDVHFTVLNTGDTQETDNWGLTEEQQSWVKKDLLSTDKKWKIVAMHNPLYSPGKYGSLEDYNFVALVLRNQLNEVFSQCGVDLVLTGHDHVYSRTYPVSAGGEPLVKTKTVTENDIVYMVDPQGPVHLASGTAGNQARGIADSIGEGEQKMFQQMRGMENGHCSYSAITVEGDKLTVGYYDVDCADGAGELVYSWGIVKK